MRYLPLISMAILLGACGKQQAKMDYPVAPADSTTYEVFGMTVSDAYRPLENDTAAATLEWVKAENELTNEYLSQIPCEEGGAAGGTDRALGIGSVKGGSRPHQAIYVGRVDMGISISADCVPAELIRAKPDNVILLHNCTSFHIVAFGLDFGKGKASEGCRPGGCRQFLCLQYHRNLNMSMLL